MVFNKLFERCSIMPSENNIAGIIEYLAFDAVVLFHFRAVVWSAVAENKNSVAIFEVGLNEIFLWEHWLCFVRKSQVMFIKIFQELVFC